MSPTPTKPNGTLSLLCIGLLTLTVLNLAATTAHATWSIVIADTRTKELAAGTVTCNTGGDVLPLFRLVVGKGVGVAQAAGDTGGVRRQVIWDGLKSGGSPRVILEKLAAIPGGETRQYGIVDTHGRKATFTGSSTADWAGGVTEKHGTMVYSVQGNILAGECVVSAIENAIRSTPGDIPAKLMAGMQAARHAGGDRRCSCPKKYSAKECGCPPPDFAKSGHRGGMIVARIGDQDFSGQSESSRTDPGQFMYLSVTCQEPNESPDPVVQLQKQFDDWRANLLGRPDAVRYQIATVSPLASIDGLREVVMFITLNDWQEQRIKVPIRRVTVVHAPDSAGISKIGAITDNGDGTLALALTTGPLTGTDHFVVTVDDGKRPVTLMPNPSLQFPIQADP